MAELQRGVVRWFNDAKGFGFIEHETGRDVFVHYSIIEQEGFKTLKDGEEVDYELHDGDKGLHALRVLRVNAPSAEASAEEAATESKEALAAPKLETGTVNTKTKPVAAMIEVEQQSASEQVDSVLSAPQEEAEEQSSLDQ